MSKDTLYFEEVPLAACTCFPSEHIYPVYEAVAAQSTATPSPRGSHSMTRMGDSTKFVLFGGSNRVADFMDDVYLFDATTQCWTKIGCEQETKKRPCKRAGHSAVWYNGKVIIYGGQSLRVENNEAVLDLLSDAWMLIPPQEGKEETAWKWEEVVASNEQQVQLHRNAHSANVVGSRMFVIGGGSAEGPRGDAIALDLETLAWQLVDAKGDIPPAREMHATCCIGSNIYVSGGRGTDRVFDTLYVLDTAAQSWTLLGLCPTRCAHSLWFVEKDNVSSSAAPSTSLLCMFGGTDGAAFYNTLHVYLGDINALLSRAQKPVDEAVDNPTASSAREQDTIEVPAAPIDPAISVLLPQPAPNQTCRTCGGPFGWASVNPAPRVTATEGHDIKTSTIATSSSSSAPASDDGVQVSGKFSELSLAHVGRVSESVLPDTRFVHSMVHASPHKMIMFGGINQVMDLNDMYSIVIQTGSQK